jgi:hypothetical protein
MNTGQPLSLTTPVIIQTTYEQSGQDGKDRVIYEINTSTPQEDLAMHNAECSLCQKQRPRVIPLYGTISW